MPTEYIILRYLYGTLWHLSVYQTQEEALAEYNAQIACYRGSKIQLKKSDNGIVSTLLETRGGTGK